MPIQGYETCPLTIGLAVAPRDKAFPDLVITDVQVMGVHRDSLLGLRPQAP